MSPRCRRTLILLCFLVSVTITVDGETKANQSNNTNYLTNHDPIEITSDEDFLAFPGSGTYEDPYLIENYNITSSTSFGIHITSTTKHFLIRNCYIDI